MYHSSFALTMNFSQKWFTSPCFTSQRWIIFIQLKVKNENWWVGMLPQAVNENWWLCCHWLWMRTNGWVINVYCYCQYFSPVDHECQTKWGMKSLSVTTNWKIKALTMVRFLETRTFEVGRMRTKIFSYW